MRLNLWRHPQSGAYRLYLHKSDVERAMAWTGDDESPPTAPSVWLEGGREGQWRVVGFTEDGDRMPYALRRQVVRLICMETGTTPRESWSALIERAENQDQLQHPGEKKSHPPAASAHPGEGGPNESTGTTRATSGLQAHAEVTLGARETEAFEQALGEYSQITLVRDSHQWADLRCRNERGDELLIVRQRCEDDTTAASALTGESWLFEHADHLGFVASANDHRIVPIILIEGGLRGFPGGPSSAQIEGALAYISAVDQVGVLPSTGLGHSTEIIMRLIGHFQRSAHTGNGTRRGETLLDHKRRLLEAIPGLSRTLAEALLARFGSVRAIAEAPVARIQCIEGIGEKRANTISRVLNHGNERQSRP